MDKKYFKESEVNGWQLLEKFNEATKIFNEIKNSSFNESGTTGESIDGTGYSTNKLGEVKYWNIEVKVRNLNLLDNGKISGCTDKGHVYIEDTIFIESHKAADLLLDKINGLTPLYVNFLSDGHVVIYNLDKLRYRPKKSGNLNIRSKGYGKIEIAKINAIQKEFEEIENKIFEAEERKEELEALLSGGETNHEKLGEYGREYATLQENLEKMYSRWEELGVLRPY